MRALIKKFKPALNGLALAAHDRSVAIQLAFAGVLAGLAGAGVRFFWEWTLVITLAALVITAEILNTAIERLCDFVQPKQDARIKTIKDLAAGAVLCASGGADRRG